MEAVEPQASAPVLWLMFASKLQPDDHRCSMELLSRNESIKINQVVVATLLLGPCCYSGG
jgi:archaellum component FlaD/FlaE